MSDDKRLIEDYLPIVAISAEASREKSVRKGHISTLHLWWARRPLVACRAAVYGALMPVSRFVPNAGSDEKKKSLGRANAAKFVERLCKYPGSPAVIAEAQRHILEAHAERLTREMGKKVTVEDIVAGRAPRPKVLDMFAGGGAIPLEALRLGCEAYALDLNPVAHIIELCTLVYPQKYGKPDPNIRGMTGAKNAKGETTWGGLAAEVRYWGNWVLEKVRAEIGNLYPLIPDPEFKGKRQAVQGDLPALASTKEGVPPPGYLMPVAYLWTRTVTCKNPNCRATVPLVKQTWLCKKKDRYVAMKVIAPRGKKHVRFEVVETHSESALGFDPAAFSKGGNATCLFCSTVADNDYVKIEGWAGRMGTQLMAAVFTRAGSKGKIYLAADAVPNAAPDEALIRQRIEKLCERTGMAVPNEPMPDHIVGGGGNCRNYGFLTFGALFISRQMLSLLSFAAAVKESRRAMQSAALDQGREAALLTVLAAIVDRLADFNSALCTWNYTGGRGVIHTFARQAMAMVWDFAETNPFNPEAASWISGIADVPTVFEREQSSQPAFVVRGTATTLPWPDNYVDAVVTDPPYYDNVGYAILSDFFYVWLKQTVGDIHKEHFAGESTPKRQEAIADGARHDGSKDKARQAYEEMMAQAFREAHRVLKPAGEFVVVYAHKTTLGWTTLVDALRGAGFTVTEAWPLDTERKGRLLAMESAALATSIFLVARKRNGEEAGNYEQVRPELEAIVRERVETLWDMGISGADLVIASVGAGLRAFTRFARVEYANGEEVPAERFLTEVETVVLETILSRLSKEVGGKGGQYSLASLDTASRFYVLWRYTYGAAELDAGEAIIFANGTHVELDGQHGLTSGNDALVEKKKSKYRLRDYSERGENDKLGLLAENGQAAPLIDMLHRMLWLMEKRPAELAAFLTEARPNREQLRLVAQALAGPALKGGEMGDISPTAELSALAKLMANWQSVIEEAVLTPSERRERKTGQRQLI